MRNWTPKQLKGLNDSIRHWKHNVRILKKWDTTGFKIKRGWREWINDKTKTEMSFNGDKCALCDLYANPNCRHCPLRIEWCCCNDYKSSWRNLVFVSGNKKIIKAAERMLKLLIKVRDARNG